MESTTEQVIKQIAQVQVEALQTIRQNPRAFNRDLVGKLFSKEYSDETFVEDIIKAIDSRLEVYKNILERPSFIMMLDEYQLLICSHILFKLEDEWINENVEGVLGTWQLLNDLLEKYHPELRLVIC